MRLSNATLAQSRAVTPAYDRSRITPGVVHLGIGNFHRAHQAVYLDDCLATDPSWGIRGISLRRPDMHDALSPQDGLYTISVNDGGRSDLRVIGSILDILHGPGDPDATLAALTDPAIRIVSLTVTEKGYCHDPATGNLDPDHVAVKHDLENPGVPAGVPGLLAAALRIRRENGTAPFTVMSCDNLPGNGATLAKITAQFAALTDDALSSWITGNVAFPSTMIDRIVPATTDADRAETNRTLGLQDAWPVMTEPFSQWVIEDVFPSGRPDFAAVGAELVSDVEPFELMKLRTLNGAHTTLACLGQLAGLETVADAMANPGIRALVRGLMRDEVAPTLSIPDDTLARYADDLIQRFDNTSLRHRTGQIAMDGSQKVPQRLLGTIRDRMATGADWRCLRLGVAAWISYVITRKGQVDDPMAGTFQGILSKTPDPAATAEEILNLTAVFGDLTGNTAFRTPVLADVGSLTSGNISETLHQAVSR